MNSKGGIIRNIPCDLHNEHVNRIPVFKEATGNMDSNFTQTSTTRVARSVIFLDKMAHTCLVSMSCSLLTVTHTTLCVNVHLLEG